MPKVRVIIEERNEISEFVGRKYREWAADIDVYEIQGMISTISTVRVRVARVFPNDARFTM
jgi:hypothetical protein